MKNNWLKAVNDLNKSIYQIPDGWDTKDQVAEKLQCAPDRVADLLRPGIQAGEFEKQEFSVWDESRRLTTRVTCYRIATGERSAPAPEAPATTQQGREERVRQAILRHPDETDSRIARRVYKISSKDVRRIRSEMGGGR